MLKYKLAISLIVLFITTGCQQLYDHAISIPDTGTAPSETDNAKTADDQSGTDQKNGSISRSSGLGTVTITSTNPIKGIGDETSSAQGKIDQALELCDYAQQMWEEGKLEEALTSLDSAYYSILEIDPDADPKFNQQKDDIRYLISKRVLEIYASRQIVVNGHHNEIPMVLNQHVQAEIKRLTGPQRKFFIQSMERGARYRPFILAELKKAGLPEDIGWLPLIESGFKIRALSHARALGIWQFIPSTGYKFGLNRNHYIDERLDPEKATRAAISYLKELHNLFGDWTTALAAYNCGEYRVLRIIRKQKINYLDNFWDLYQKLPRETAQYVPRFLATIHIVNNLEKYNMKPANPLSPIEFTTFEIKKQVKLADIAKGIGVSTALLKDLNPELRYALLPPEPYTLKVPVEKAGIFLSKIDKIKTTHSAPPPPNVIYHRVRKGDTLSVIAEKYKTSVRAIATANNIGRKHKIIAGKVLKIPGKGGGGKAGSVAATRKPLKKKKVKYKVRGGDNLWNIARKFNTTTKRIMTQNKLRNTKLRIGQTLYITSGKGSYLAKKRTSTYKVRSGDSPFSVAKKHKMSLKRLLALNDLTKKSKIFPGQKLIIE